MKSYEQATSNSSALDLLDQIRMSPGERRMARMYFLQAGLLADRLMRLHAGLRHVFGLIGRGIGACAWRDARCKVNTELKLRLP